MSTAAVNLLAPITEHLLSIIYMDHLHIHEDTVPGPSQEGWWGSFFFFFLSFFLPSFPGAVNGTQDSINVE